MSVDLRIPSSLHGRRTFARGLEYVPGGSIASCLRKHGKFDEEVTKSFTGQILSGLEYLHLKGILHRVSVHLSLPFPVLTIVHHTPFVSCDILTLIRLPTNFLNHGRQCTSGAVGPQCL